MFFKNFNSTDFFDSKILQKSNFGPKLGHFSGLNKGKFIGLEALNQWREKGFNNKLITMEVHNTTDADVLGNNPVYENGSVIGRATGGDFGFRLDICVSKKEDMFIVIL